MNYFIQLDEEIQGPLTFDELKHRFSSGNLKEYDLVRREDQRDWKPLSAFQELHDSIELGPPLSNPAASISLILIFCAVGLLLYDPILKPWFLIPSFLAIIFGHIALYRIRHTAREVKGYQIAKNCTAIGYFLLIVIPFIMSFSSYWHRGTSEVGNMTRGRSNCRQVITFLKIYAADNSGAYPDSGRVNPQSSNDIFRQLFMDGYTVDEKIFGCPLSPFNPDGKIGEKPNYIHALEPGENHWAMTSGLFDASSGSSPLVYENPIDASWPPKWKVGKWTKRQPGRAWSARKIIVGLNDGSVSLYPLDQEGKCEPRSNSQPIFPMDDPNLKVLNVAK